jgi:hypothetical protein
MVVLAVVIVIVSPPPPTAANVEAAVVKAGEALLAWSRFN